MMSPANGPYTPYNPYPPYPAYAPYPTYPASNPWRSHEQAATNAEPAPEARAVRGFWSGRFGMLIAAVTVVVTIGAIALAAIAAPIHAAQAGATPPAGFTQVYNASLSDTSDDGKWADTAPCTLTAQGLDVTGGAGGTACAFQPSKDSNLTSQGFWIQATVAPAAAVQQLEVPVVLIGDNEPILFDQQGSYVIYCRDDNTPCAQGSATAWHTNDFVANTITVSYDAGSTTLTVFVNGQLVTSVPMTQSGQPTLALGAGGGGESLFTHVSIYSASG